MNTKQDLKGSLLFFLQTDKATGATTLAFTRKRIKLSNAQDFLEMKGAIDVLSQTMKELLQSYFGEASLND